MTHYLHHVTLTTGHSRRSYRHEVADAAVAEGRRLIAEAVGGSGDATLAGEAAHCRLKVSVDGHQLLATVLGPTGPTLPDRPCAGEVTPLVTFGAVRRSRAAPRLWEQLAALAGVALPERPPAPWCAVVLHPGLSLHPDATDWLGDLERIVAWAWIESR